MGLSEYCCDILRGEETVQSSMGLSEYCCDILRGEETVQSSMGLSEYCCGILRIEERQCRIVWAFLSTAVTS